MIELLKLAGALGGFAGLAFFAVVIYIGREVRAMREALDRFTQKDLLMLVASDLVHYDVKKAAEELLLKISDAQPPKKK
jgi:hypothetical protein